MKNTHKLTAFLLSVVTALTPISFTAFAEGEGGTTVTTYAAAINDTKYETLKDAIKSSANGDTVKLLQDVHIGLEDFSSQGTYYGMDYYYYVATKKTLTLDLDGHKIDLADSAKNYDSSKKAFYRSFYMSPGANITVTGNGTIDFDAAYNVTPYIFVLADPTDNPKSTLTFENGTYYAGPCVAKSYSSKNEVNVNGGTFGLSKTYTANAPQEIQGVLNTAGVVGSLEMFGGTIIGNHPGYLADGSGVATGYSVSKVGENYSVISDKNVKATLSTTYNGYCEQSTQARYDNIPVTYGYTSLTDALANATDGDTITLTVNASGDGAVVKEGTFPTKGLTLDLGGFTYTVDGKAVGSPGTLTNGFQFLSGNKITIKNGTLTTAANVTCENNTDGVYTAAANMLIQNYSDLNLDGVTLDGTNLRNTGYTLSNCKGDVNIKNSTINTNGHTFAFDVDNSRSTNQTITVDNSTINGLVEISGNNGKSAKLVSGSNEYGEDGHYIQRGDEFLKAYILTFNDSDIAKVHGVFGMVVDLSQYTPTKSGYTFEGWYSDSTFETAVTEITLDSDKTVYAKWNKIPVSNGGSGSTLTSYTVKFDTNGGSKISNKSVNRNKTVAEPTEPTKDGYTFGGWYTDKDLTTKYDFATKVTKSITLYAAWDEVEPAEPVNNTITLTIGKTDANAFGKTVTNDVAPLITNDRTMLPARFVAESLGATVEWDGENEVVTITGKNVATDEDVTIVITIGADTAVVNGTEVELDSPAFIENERTYTPLRFIAENLGADVEWNEENQTVIITVE